MSSCIDIRAVGKIFGQGSKAITALDQANLDIAHNEFVTFVGASGCGKSTLLRIIGGLESHTSGSVTVNGREIFAPGVDRAMVFQHYSLYPWLTVIEVQVSSSLRPFSSSSFSRYGLRTTNEPDSVL